MTESARCEQSGAIKILLDGIPNSKYVTNYDVLTLINHFRMIINNQIHLQRLFKANEDASSHYCHLKHLTAKTIK